MKKTSRLNPIIFAICMLALSLPAKAQYILKEADAQYELFNYIKAIDLYEQAYQKKQSLHAIERLASCYELVHDYKQTESWAAKAVGMEGSNAENVLRYAKALQNNSKYEEAKVQYQKYFQLNSKIAANQKSLWLLSCDSAMHWMKKPSTITVLNEKRLNTPQSDWGAVKKDNSIVFASDRPVAADSVQHQSTKRPFFKFDGAKRPNRNIYGWTDKGYMHLYQQRDSVANLFPLQAGTDYHVGPTSFTENGDEMFFTLTRIPEKIVFENGKLATINVEIYSSKKTEDGKWSTPVPFPYNNINEHSVGDPFVSKDGKVLYFSANFPGGKGGTDLYASFLTESGNWEKPVNLGEVNTEGNERTPFFDENNNLYFSSDGLVGMGGLDIFRAAVRAGKVGKPINMGYPVNSPQDDFAYSQDGTLTGYLSSDRTEGLGSDDIYSFKKQEIIIFRLTGIAYDKATGSPLANAIVTLAKTGGGSLKAQTETDGYYMFNLEKAADYNLKGEKTGCQSDEAAVSTQKLITSTNLKQDLYLEAIVINKGIKLENLYYDFDKSNIRPDAAIELDKLIKIMKDNPTIWIELGSHTDSRGDDNYNQRLSQSRANSAVQYIIDHGINKNRITAKGYGESQLVNKCSNDVKCTEQEHQANRRTEFKATKM